MKDKRGVKIYKDGSLGVNLRTPTDLGELRHAVAQQLSQPIQSIVVRNTVMRVLGAVSRTKDMKARLTIGVDGKVQAIAKGTLFDVKNPMAPKGSPIIAGYTDPEQIALFEEIKKDPALGDYVLGLPDEVLDAHRGYEILGMYIRDVLQKEGGDAATNPKTKHYFNEIRHSVDKVKVAFKPFMEIPD